MIVASRPIGRTDLKESVYLRLDTSRSSWNVFLGSFVQPVSVIASISVLPFDALQQLPSLSETVRDLGTTAIRRLCSVYPRLSSWHRISGLRMTAYFEAVA